MLTLKQRQERAARRAARIAAKHMAIRSAALGQGEAREARSMVMKKNEVKAGGTYLAKVSDKVVPVRITGESRYGGWDAVNTKTGKTVRIKSAQRLRGPATLSKAEVQAAKTAVAAATGEAKAVLGPAAKDLSKVLGVPVVVAPDAKAAKAEKAVTVAKRKAEKPKRKGALDAAVEVLKAAAGGPLGAKEMVERMLAKGLWQTKGKTPAATLYAAIIREIAAKGKEARFHKTARGMFELSAAARQ
jgi:hypothetical protein